MGRNQWLILLILSLCLPLLGHIEVVAGSKHLVYALIRSWNVPSPGTSSGPSGIALDSRGRVFVSDWGGGRILKFANTGQLLSIMNCSKGQMDKISKPYCIAVGSNDVVYVISVDSNHVARFSSSGQRLADFKPQDGGEIIRGATCLAVDGSGNLYIGSYSGQVMKINRDGKKIAQWAVESATGQFFGMAVGPGGDVYCIRDSNHSLLRFSTNGRLLNKSQEVGIDGVGEAFGVSVDRKGNVYVVVDSVKGMRVQRFSKSLVLQTSLTIPGDSRWMARAVATDALDRVYVLAVGTKVSSKIHVFGQER
jgi:sugar lactone lactonase YvrE